MAHPEQAQYVKSIKSRFPRYFTDVKVLDIGSLDVNGNNRGLFLSSDYTGIDVGNGRNVDAVSKGHEWDVPSDTYDTIISTECFEHDRFFNLTVKNVVRMLKPGGMFVFTCATTGRHEHGTNNVDPGASPLTSNLAEFEDHYKNITEEDVRSVINVDAVFSEYEFTVNGPDLYFYGISRLYPEDQENPPVVLCIPTLRRYDLLEKCISSTLSGTRVPDRIIVIDNGYNYIPTNPRVEVVKPELPMCVAATWNYFMSNYPGIKIITNDDIEFGSTTIETAVNEFRSYPDHDMFLMYGYSCYILRDRTFKSIGRFDENFQPAYFEDNDHHHRMVIAGAKTKNVEETGVIHLGSQTIKSYSETEMDNHHRTFNKNREYYISKWGGQPDSETVNTPYKRDYLPV